LLDLALDARAQSLMNAEPQDDQDADHEEGCLTGE
jgi:hypothetical protein